MIGKLSLTALHLKTNIIENIILLLLQEIKSEMADI